MDRHNLEGRILPSKKRFGAPRRARKVKVFLGHAWGRLRKEHRAWGMLRWRRREQVLSSPCWKVQRAARGRSRRLEHLWLRATLPAHKRRC